MKKVNALVISGYGINCERELAFACELAGAHAEIMHARQLLMGQVAWNKYRCLLFPGGFSFGDDLGAGKAFANRLSFSQRNLLKDLSTFVQDGNCILGICNGFQLLVKLGLLPGFPLAQKVSLASNDLGRFENRWVDHQIIPSPCIFTQGIESLYLPIRHGEGKFVVQDSGVLEQLKQERRIVLRYSPDNPNGSIDSVGGVCDATGRILGMMAHPEAATLASQHPQWLRQKEYDKRKGTQHASGPGPGLAIFKNLVHYLENN